MKIQHVLFGEVKVPIFKWKGNESSWADLEIWCREVGISTENHFELDPIQPDWLTHYTGENYLAGQRVRLSGACGDVFFVKLPGTWSMLMVYSQEEVKKSYALSFWIFRSIVRHDSAAKYATHSAGKVASVPLERLPLIPLQSTPL
jgi:hypothetical protein